MSDISKHKRVNDILLGPIERPALQWLSAHAPAWITPDIMTTIGIAGAIIIAVGYALSNFHPAFFWLATLGFIINWYGDSLDGTLARFRHIERPKFGFYIDHVSDVITEILIVLGLGLSPYIGFSVAAMTCIAYIAMSVLIYVRMNVTGEFKISYSKLGPTEVRVIAILLNTAMFFAGPLTFNLNLAGVNVVISIYDVFVAAIGLLIFFFFGVTSVQESIRLRQLGE